MKGKCYRCSSGDHMANSCSVAKEVKCRSCNATGHIATACTPTANVRAVEGESGQGNSIRVPAGKTAAAAAANSAEGTGELCADIFNAAGCEPGQKWWPVLYFSTAVAEPANIYAVYTKAEGERKEEKSAVQLPAARAFVNNQKEAMPRHKREQYITSQLLHCCYDLLQREKKIRV